MLSSDNGFNFVGTQKELKSAYGEIDNQKIQFLLQNNGGYYINWHRNPPALNCMGVFGKDKLVWYVQYRCLYCTHMEDL